MSSFTPGPDYLTAEMVYESLKELHRKLVARLRAEGKTADWMPAWYLHLPSGEKVRIKYLGGEGALIRFGLPDEETQVIVAPSAVAITIESQDSESFPVELLDELDDSDSE